jgi:DNA repair exonuclease SbcCD ATPase subunit
MDQLAGAQSLRSERVAERDPMSQQQPSRDRDWEHWPGRGEPDERIRSRLRSLFHHAPTRTDSAVEELIAERGRELERRSEQLASTVADLQRREERARELRHAVEAMLRHGSAELDDRNGQLNELAQELTRREHELVVAEQELAERRGEVGAVELRRAALERRETSIAEREAALERIAGILQERERDLNDREHAVAEAPPPSAQIEPEPGDAPAELVFVAGDRYRLLEQPGGTLRPGETIDVDGVQHTVVRVGASPLPGDRRRCAYAEPSS